MARVVKSSRVDVRMTLRACVAELAMSLQLQEVPTVFAIHAKKVVNKISGNLSDTEVQVRLQPVTAASCWPKP